MPAIRMSEEKWKRLKDSRGELGYWIARDVVAELDRARESEAQLMKRVAELEEERDELFYMVRDVQHAAANYFAFQQIVDRWKEYMTRRRHAAAKTGKPKEEGTTNDNDSV